MDAAIGHADEDGHVALLGLVAAIRMRDTDLAKTEKVQASAEKGTGFGDACCW